MDERLKQRLVGAAVLVSAAVIFVPMILDRGSDPDETVSDSNLPPRPQHTFRSRIVAVQEAEVRVPPAVRETPTASPAAEPSPPEPRTPPANRPAKADARDKPTAAPALAEPGQQAQSGLTAWAVQLGSFSERENATELRDRLRAKGYTAFVESVRLQGSRSMRVYVGPELLRSKATESQERLRKEFGMEGLVVRYPSS
jgi:DedD protein